MDYNKVETKDLLSAAGQERMGSDSKQHLTQSRHGDFTGEIYTCPYRKAL